jgi:hypothetical protein
LGGIGGEEGSTIGSNGDYLHVGGTEVTASGAKPSYCGNTYTDRTNDLRKCESAIVRPFVHLFILFPRC